MEEKKKETISVSLVKKVVEMLEKNVTPGSYELKATPKEIRDSIKVVKFRSYAGKKWTHQYPAPRGKKMIVIEKTNVIVRDVTIFHATIPTAEFEDGSLMNLDNHSKFDSWEEILLRELENRAINQEVIPVSLTPQEVKMSEPVFKGGKKFIVRITMMDDNFGNSISGEDLGEFTTLAKAKKAYKKLCEEYGSSKKFKSKNFYLSIDSEINVGNEDDAEWEYFETHATKEFRNKKKMTVAPAN